MDGEQQSNIALEDSILSNKRIVPTPDWTIEYAPKDAKEPEVWHALYLFIGAYGS